MFYLTMHSTHNLIIIIIIIIIIKTQKTPKQTQPNKNAHKNHQKTTQHHKPQTNKQKATSTKTNNKQQHITHGQGVTYSLCSSKGQVRSGQCLTCTFRASCCSARLSRAQVTAFAGSSVWNRKKKGGGEGVRRDRLHWRVQGSTSSPTGIGSTQRVV